VSHGPVRASRVSRWRAAVLIAIHVAIALHVAHWAWSGSTLTPLEPSESIELTAKGVLNAGAIFFGVAILSTALFGRFFCGWACHLVAIQDACRWLLEKVGLRPRAVNLGILGLVPLVVFVYMFLAPLLPRVEQGLGLGIAHTEFTTEGFWDTFPGFEMALLTFVVGGFLMVWFLGAKGFCTYACPYGAVFGIADQVAPLRIRVTDACEGCGHCTAVCTSNVRVHQEVRDWKAVVDPGCMKCLDCVSVCPKDALYVGWGAPALAASRVRPAKAALEGLAKRGPRALMTAAFLFASFLVLLSRQGTLELRWALELAGLSLLLALIFPGKAERRGGPSVGEELVLAGAFLGALYALRGYQLLPWEEERVPLLLALGLAVLFAFSVHLGGRILRRSEVALQAWDLVRGGKTTGAGRAVVAVALGFLALVATAGRSQWNDGREQREARVAREAQAREQRVAEEAAVRAVAQSRERARSEYDRGVRAAQAGSLEEASKAFEAALALDPELHAARENLAGMYCAMGRYQDGIFHYRVSLERHPDDPDLHALLGQASAQAGDLAAAEAAWLATIRLAPSHRGARLGLAILCEDRGDAAGAAAHRAAAGR
jgi:polyferredoxin/Flp pilus assembly protein TadD